MKNDAYTSHPTVRLAVVVFAFLTTACSSATYIKARVPDNPLSRVAQEAEKEWSVDRINENTLEISDAWPFYSIGALGYGASYANLFYDPTGPDLYVQYYFKAHPLVTLWIPISLDAEPGFAGALLKPTMNDQISDIMRWIGATEISRRAGSSSEAFPPRRNVPSQVK